MCARRPLLVGLGYRWPTLRLPYLLMFYVAWAMELLHVALAVVGVRFVPLLNRAEVNKCAGV